MTTLPRTSVGPLPLFTLLLAAVAPAVAGAQIGDVWVVDAAAGPGTDFTAIQAAVDAASAGDTIVVRSGFYPAFGWIGKNLAVVADEGATVRVQGGPSVAFTPNGPPNVLHGLSFMGGGGADPIAPISTGDGGAKTWVSDCTTQASWIYVSSSSVVFDHCSFRGPDAGASGGLGALPALDQGISFVAAFATDFRGGDGADGGPAAPTAGATAVASDTATWAARCQFFGGQGGDGAFDALAGCFEAETGGAAVAVEDWFYGNANLHVGGPGGAADPGCAGGPGATGGGVELVGPFAQEVTYAAPVPLLDAPGVAREGQAVALDWEGPAGAAIVLVSGGVDFKHSSFSPLTLGSMPLLVAEPFSIHLVGLLAADGSASLSLTVPELGPGVASRRVFVQALHLDTSTFAVNSGGARAVVLLDSAY